jgi:transcriptional regulator with XRE-family HTH domain
MLDDEDHRHVVKRLRALLTRRRWTVERLADEAGVLRGCLRGIMERRHSPTVRTLRRLAAAFGVSVRSLLP